MLALAGLKLPTKANLEASLADQAAQRSATRARKRAQVRQNDVLRECEGRASIKRKRTLVRRRTAPRSRPKHSSGDEDADVPLTQTRTMRHECPRCLKRFVSLTNHTECPAGHCSDCGLFHRNLRNHACSLRKYRQPVCAEALARFIRRNGRACDGCGDIHALVRNSFRPWRDLHLCRDCFAGNAEIRATIDDLWERVTAWHLREKQTACAECARALLDPESGQRLAGFELDHTRFWDKVDGVGNMVRRGDAWERIEAELAKCRPLCLRCHSLVTAAETVQGYMDLKRMAACVERSDVARSVAPCRATVERWRAEVERDYMARVGDLTRRLRQTTQSIDLSRAAATTADDDADDDEDAEKNDYLGTGTGTGDDDYDGGEDDDGLFGLDWDALTLAPNAKRSRSPPSSKTL